MDSIDNGGRASNATSASARAGTFHLLDQTVRQAWGRSERLLTLAEEAQQAHEQKVSRTALVAWAQSLESVLNFVVHDESQRLGRQRANRWDVHQQQLTSFGKQP